MQSCLCLRSLLRIDENMLEIGSMAWSHVFLEAEADSYLSEALSTKVEAILADDWSVLAATFAWPRAFPVLSDLLRFYLGQFAF